MKPTTLGKILFCAATVLFQEKLLSFDEVLHRADVEYGAECILGADIGGTNSDFGIFQIKDKKPTLLFSLHTPTKTISDFPSTMRDIIAYAKNSYGITIHHVCMGTPGLRSEHRDYNDFISGPDNKHYVVDAQAIKKKTGLETVIIVNDFELIGYGIELLDSSSVVVLHKGKPRATGQKLIVGAGTGLGTSYMIWNNQLGHHFPVESELGCSDFSPLNQFELMVAQQAQEKAFGKATWDRVLGRGGVVSMHDVFTAMLEGGSLKKRIDLSAKDIFSRYGADPVCTASVALYLRLYARFAKLASLSVLPFGGLYIAGGVAAKNSSIFKNGIFLQEFFDEPQSTWLYDFLQSIPIYLIDDYKVSLYGAAQYLAYELEEKTLNSGHQGYNAEFR